MSMTLEEQVRLLSMVDIFEVLSREELEELSRRGPDTLLDEGEVFLMPREGGERLFVLKKGRADKRFRKLASTILHSRSPHRGGGGPGS
jgi:hypothetical protein